MQYVEKRFSSGFALMEDQFYWRVWQLSNGTTNEQERQDYTLPTTTK